MTEHERKIRFEVAVDIVEDVFKDMCHDSLSAVSRETTRELCDFLIDMRKWAEVVGGERSLDDIINAAKIKSDMTKETSFVKDDFVFDKG